MAQQPPLGLDLVGAHPPQRRRVGVDRDRRGVALLVHAMHVRGVEVEGVAGGVFDFGASHVHRMRQDSDVPAVSIHAYSPPLWRMGTYVVEEDGTLRRESISYAEELRPVDAAA